MSEKVVLSAARLARLHRAIHDVYQASSHDEFISRAISQFRALAPSDYVSYNEVGPRPDQILARLWPDEAAQPDILATWARLAHQSPLLRYYQRTKDGSPRRLSDVISTDNLRALPLWQELYKYLQVNYQLACALPAPQPLVIGIAASRASRDYSDTERALLALLRPHLIQAHDRTLELDRLRARLTALETTLGAAREAVILIPTTGFPSTEGAGDNDILSRWLSATSHTRSHIIEWVHAQRQRLEPHAGHLPTLGTPLIINNERGSLTATYIHHVTDEFDAAVLRECSGPAGHDLTFTAKSLGLTARQVQIAALAARGNTNHRTGQLLGISAATVKKHLENIYARLGVTNRTELVSLLLHAAVSPPEPETSPSSPVPNSGTAETIVPLRRPTCPDEREVRPGFPPDRGGPFYGARPAVPSS
jgi:DNA-binding CsgD family transcriptional regulator